MTNEQSEHLSVAAPLSFGEGLGVRPNKQIIHYQTDTSVAAPLSFGEGWGEDKKDVGM